MSLEYEKVFGVHRADKNIEDDGCRLTDLQLYGYVQPNGTRLLPVTRMRYYREPNTYPMNLKCGPDHGVAQPKIFNPEMRLEYYQLALVRQFGTRTRTLLQGLDFCTHSAAMQRIMMTPYRPTHDWQLVATRYHRRIYLNLRAEEHDEQGSSTTPRSPYDTKLTQYCFTNAPNGVQMTAERCLAECPPMYGVFRGSLRHINLLWAAEISGLLNDQPLAENDLLMPLGMRHVLVRTMRMEPKWRSNERMLDWALDALLSNAERVTLGFFNRAGVVHYKMLHVGLNDIVQNQRWKLHCCMGFLYKLLDRIEDIIGNDDCAYTTWDFKYFAEDDTVRYRKHEGKTNYSFFSQQMVNCLDNIYL